MFILNMFPPGHHITSKQMEFMTLIQMPVNASVEFIYHLFLQTL